MRAKTDKEPSPETTHEWSQALQQSSHILGSKTHIEDTDGSVQKSSLAFANQGSVFVSVSETEKIVESLQPFSVEEVSTSPFLEMYACDVERLSLQAHASAQMNNGNGGDEYVVEAILTFSKIPVLVQTLLAVEAWRVYVLRCDRLAPLVAKNQNSLRCAFTLHVETTLVCLLNLIFYRQEACSEIDAETSVAIVDYCARSMASLAIPLCDNDVVRRQKEPMTSSQLSEYLSTRSSMDGIMDNRFETEFKTSVAATALARYLCEHIEKLSLSAQTRILDTHDYLVMMVPLIHEPPWTRRRIIIEKDGNKKPIWEKYVENCWEIVPSMDLLQITKCEAQCWIAIFHLTCSKICRKQYGLNTFRKEQLLRLRKFLNDVMLDQLPVLSEVRRYMDELALMKVPENSTGQGSSLLIQQVSLKRDSLIRGKNFDIIAKNQYEEFFSTTTDATDMMLRKISDIYSMNGVEDTLERYQFSSHEPKSKQVHQIFLQIKKGDESVQHCDSDPPGIYILKPDVNSEIVETKKGPFKRTKMKISLADGEEIIPISNDVRMEIIVHFDGDICHNVTLTCDELNLPCANDLKKFQALPTMEWRQFGSIQDKIAIQVGLRRLNRDHKDSDSNLVSYALHSAFLSQPHEEL